VYITRADDSRIPVSINTAVLRDSMGKMIGGVEIFRDLTELTRLRKAVTKGHSFNDIVSKNKIMQRYFSILPQIAESNSTVLIDGPTGTGRS
jgi:transcriptional regulator with PAS, ATPase and Fis domain